MEQTPVETGNEAEAKLLRSALTLFSEKGYEAASIREIIEGAGVTRPVLYYYFKNKEDLFRRLIDPVVNEFTEKLREIPTKYAESVGRLKAVMRLSFALAERNPRAVRLIMQMYFSPPKSGPKIDKSALRRQRFQSIQDIIQDGLDKAELVGGDAQSLTLVFISIMDTHSMAKSQMSGIRLTTELAEGLVDLFFYGACYKENPPTALVSPFQYV